MSTSPAPSALDANTQTFPTLTAAQISRIRALGKLRRVEPGEILFQPGDTSLPFFVVLSGKLEILQPKISGEHLLVTHGPGQFTGEMVMISGHRSMVRARVTEAGEVLELANEALRALIASDAELSDTFMRAFILRRLLLIREGRGNVIVMGSRHSASTLHLREFLTRNAHPFTYVDLDSDKDSQQLLDRFHVELADIPVVICGGGTVMRNPTSRQLAECLGFNVTIDPSHVRDVIIVGAGPAGLAAAVYAASEGLDALVIESEFPGGQAGASSKIENYVGFPTGIAGQELTNRAIAQAEKFGAKMMVAQSVVKLNCEQRPYQIILEGGESLATRAIVIATGAQYNKPAIANLQRYEGQGIYYAATFMEAQLCQGEDVVVIGGGNSAGQAAVFLAQTARKVHMLVRGKELSSTMSRYLIQRITEHPSMELHYGTEIIAVDGKTQLERVTWRNNATGETATCDVRHVFIMAGASPRTEWLRGCLSLDEQGFILTGRDLDAVLDHAPMAWPLARRPQMLETSLPAVYAVGDVRSGNVKRVASAVGEGSISIHLVHRVLAEM